MNTKKAVVVVYEYKCPIWKYRDTEYLKYIFVKNTARGFEDIRGCLFDGFIMDTFYLEGYLYEYLLSRIRER